MEDFVFLPFREAIRESVDEKLASHKVAYRVSVSGDDIWEAYLSAFPDEATRQRHNCNCCKSFIRRMGNGGIIEGGKFVPFFDISDKVAPNFKPMVEAILSLLNGKRIEKAFGTSEGREGTKSNVAQKEYGVRTFNHFYADVPAKHRKDATAISKINTGKAVLQRALEEIKPEAVTDLLDLISENGLYRGDTHQASLTSFAALQLAFVSSDSKDLFAWSAMGTVCGSVSHIRNTSVGTLLVNVSEGMELAVAVGKYEGMVAPQNYQRKKSVVTTRQVEAHRQAVEKAGYKESLPRRFARMDEMPVGSALYVDRSGTALNDVFDEMSAEVTVNPRKYANALEVSVEDFLSAREGITELECLVERNHFPNFVSLITEQNPGSPCLFSHGNPFSWAYSGGVADSMKERVKRAGGDVDGVLRISLGWRNTDDLDIHVHEPSGNHIFYGSKRSYETGGSLDVDMNVSQLIRGAVENVTWPNESSMKDGKYRVSVNNYTRREETDQGYGIEVEYKGELFTFEASHNPRSGATDTVCEFAIKDGAIKMLTGGSGSTVTSVEKWGVKSNRFYSVELMTTSPNQWGDVPVGTKHYLFLNKDFVNNESVRAFFNEQLDRELVRDHKNSFEVLGGKIKVPASKQQASGLGFAATKRASVVIRYRKAGALILNRLKF